MTILDILQTDEAILTATQLWRDHKDDNTFARRLAEQVIAPNLKAINARLGQENDARYLAYVVELALYQANEAKA